MKCADEVLTLTEQGLSCGPFVWHEHESKLGELHSSAPCVTLYNADAYLVHVPLAEYSDLNLSMPDIAYTIWM